MERRDFLKLLLAAGATVTLPSALREDRPYPDGVPITGELDQFGFPRWVKWDASAEHGMAIQYSPDLLRISVFEQSNKIRDFLISEATRTLPKGTRFQIRKQYPHDYGRTHGIAWYYHPSMMEERRWRSFRHAANDKTWDPSSGIWIIGQGTA